MFATLKVLFDGAGARAEDRLKHTYAIELIDQRIREADASLGAAKATLGSLIQRKRSEQRLRDALDGRIAGLTTRAQEALTAGRDDLATHAAQAIADMENERDLRTATIDRLGQRIIQLQASVESAHRRIVDLKQGAITARAIRNEQDIQRRLRRTTGASTAAEEAEALIKRVLDTDDPFETSQILTDIDRSLSGASAEDKLADAGFGDPGRQTAKTVLARLKAGPAADTAN
jgi:phage shock protein A